MARQERMLYSIEHRDITSGFESCRRPFDYLSPPICDVINCPEARYRGGREGQCLPTCSEKAISVDLIYTMVVTAFTRRLSPGCLE